MFAECIKTYYDKELHRTVAKGEEIELERGRFEKLSTENNDAKTILVEETSSDKTTEKAVQRKTTRKKG